MRCLYELQRKLGIAPIRETYLVRFSLELPNPREATTIVNTLVQRFVERSRSTVTDVGRSELNSFKDTQASRRRSWMTCVAGSRNCARSATCRPWKVSGTCRARSSPC